MKTSLTKLKSSLFFSLLVFGVTAFAKPVAQVTEVKGQVFAVSPDGTTKTLKLNDHVEEKTEIMVVEDASITLNDYFDATYHLVTGSHLKFFNKSVQLKKGKAWIQSLNSRHPLGLVTANGMVDYWKGEFIVTFDQASSKTQVLVVNGEVEVSNVLDRNMKYTLTGGTFTMIDPDVENGVPRAPTKVGLNSLNSAMAEFKSLPEKLQSPVMDSAPSRAIASDEEASSPSGAEIQKGEIVFLKDGQPISRRPASVLGSAHKYFKKKIFHKKVKSSPVPIHFYGFTPTLSQSKDVPRTPASIIKTPVLEAPKKIASEVTVDPEFTETLRKNQDSQPKHTKELENLIHDLQSY